MTAPDSASLDARLRAARDELRDAMEQAMRDLARFERENRPTAEEQRALQDAALRGDLGADMRTLARRVDTGEDSWDAIFSGRSPHADLLRGHLERMIAENRDAIREAIEEDDEFDPFPDRPDDPTSR
jgi:hypothetical protein